MPDTPAALGQGVAAVRNASIVARNYYNQTSAAAAAAPMPLVKSDSVVLSSLYSLHYSFTLLLIRTFIFNPFMMMSINRKGVVVHVVLLVMVLALVKLKH